MIDPELANHFKISNKRELTANDVLEKIKFILELNGKVIELQLGRLKD